MAKIGTRGNRAIARTVPTEWKDLDEERQTRYQLILRSDGAILQRRTERQLARRRGEKTGYQSSSPIAAKIRKDIPRDEYINVFRRIAERRGLTLER